MAIFKRLGGSEVAEFLDLAWLRDTKAKFQEDEQRYDGEKGFTEASFCGVLQALVTMYITAACGIGLRRAFG